MRPVVPSARQTAAWSAAVRPSFPSSLEPDRRLNSWRMSRHIENPGIGPTDGGMIPSNLSYTWLLALRAEGGGVRAENQAGLLPLSVQSPLLDILNSARNFPRVFLAMEIFASGENRTIRKYDNERERLYVIASLDPSFFLGHFASTLPRLNRPLLAPQ